MQYYYMDIYSTDLINLEKYFIRAEDFKNVQTLHHKYIEKDLLTKENHLRFRNTILNDYF